MLTTTNSVHGCYLLGYCIVWLCSTLNFTTILTYSASIKSKLCVSFQQIIMFNCKFDQMKTHTFDLVRSITVSLLGSYARFYEKLFDKAWQVLLWPKHPAVQSWSDGQPNGEFNSSQFQQIAWLNSGILLYQQWNVPSSLWMEQYDGDNHIWTG